MCWKNPFPCCRVRTRVARKRVNELFLHIRHGALKSLDIYFRYRNERGVNLMYLDSWDSEFFYRGLIFRGVSGWGHLGRLIRRFFGAALACLVLVPPLVLIAALIVAGVVAVGWEWVGGATARWKPQDRVS